MHELFYCDFISEKMKENLIKKYLILIENKRQMLL